MKRVFCAILAAFLLLGAVCLLPRGCHRCPRKIDDTCDRYRFDRRRCHHSWCRGSRYLDEAA